MVFKYKQSLWIFIQSIPWLFLYQFLPLPFIIYPRTEMLLSQRPYREKVFVNKIFCRLHIGVPQKFCRQSILYNCIKTIK